MACTGMKLNFAPRRKTYEILNNSSPQEECILLENTRGDYSTIITEAEPNNCLIMVAMVLSNYVVGSSLLFLKRFCCNCLD